MGVLAAHDHHGSARGPSRFTLKLLATAWLQQRTSAHPPLAKPMAHRTAPPLSVVVGPVFHLKYTTNQITKSRRTAAGAVNSIPEPPAHRPEHRRRLGLWPSREADWTSLRRVALI